MGSLSKDKTRKMALPPSTIDRQQLASTALCQVITGIHQRGWCDGTGGNFSAVICDAPFELLMAPSGVHKGSLTPQDLIVVDADGQVIRGEGKASAETLLHLMIIATTQAGAVLHTHSQAATLLSRHPLPGAGEKQDSSHHSPSGAGLLGHLHLTGLEMLKGLEGIQTHEQQIALPILANSQDMQLLSHAAQPLLAEAPYGLLIAGHGLYAWGASLEQAQRHLEILEFLLEQSWRELLLDAVLGNRPAAA